MKLMTFNLFLISKILIIILILNSSCGSEKVKEQNESANQQIQLSEKKEVIPQSLEIEKLPVKYYGPEYEMVTQRKLRYDGAPSFIVLTKSKIELDSLKEKIELVIRDIILKQGAKCNIEIFQDKASMSFVLSTHYFDMTLGRTLEKDDFRKYAKKWLASFAGQLETASSPNEMILLPFAAGCDCKYSKYSKIYEFNP